MITYPCTKRACCRLTELIETNMLLASQTAILYLVMCMYFVVFLHLLMHVGASLSRSCVAVYCVNCLNIYVLLSNEINK